MGRIGCLLALIPTRNSARFAARAYAISEADLVLVLGQENGRSLLGWEFDHVQLEVGDWSPLPVALAADGFAGKYNALLRLPDIAGEPAYTVTTSHRLALGPPADGYLDTIVAGLADCADQDRAVGLIRDSADHVVGDNRDFLGPAVIKPLTWSGTVSVGRTVGVPAVRLPTGASGTLDEPSLRLGSLHTKEGTDTSLWVSYSLAPDEFPTVTPDVAEMIGLMDHDQAPVRISSILPLRPPRLPGYAGDIPPPDVVQVDAQLGALLGRWALIHTPYISGPVRVLVRPHVPAQSIRIAYGVRTVLGLGSGDVQITPIEDEGRRPPVRSGRNAIWHRPGNAVRTGTRRFGEAVLGAPVVSFRATEGLVGDDGRAVVRVDSTALDYLGLDAGDRAVLNWATRSTRVRVLLQTDETRERMDQQLRESTGMQSRATMTDPASRAAVPSHLRAWVSPTVRHSMAIPPDTIVRLRRSLRHVVGRNAASLVLPFAGLTVAALAVPGIPSWVWIIVLAITLILTLLPLRLVDRSQGRRQ